MNETPERQDQTGGEAPGPSPAAPHWHLELDEDNVAWLHFDLAGSGANVLSKAALEELDARIGEIEQAGPRGLVILSDKASGFIAGADVREFTGLAEEDQAYEHIRLSQDIFYRLEALPCPTVALIRGFCLGGGTELALACRYRVAVDAPATRIGFPEVRLGIHPGFGGTVRLPPRIGHLAAMDMMLSGRALSARAARKLGLVEHAVPERQARKAARTLALQRPPATRPPLLKRLAGHRLVRPVVAQVLRRHVAKRASPEHYPAPFALIDLWRRHADEPKAMMLAEARSVARLMMGETAQNLIRVFLLQDRLKGLGRRSRNRAAHVHVIGAGTMGGDIAAWCALRGLRVSLQDQSPERIAPAVKRAHGLFQQRLKQPRLVQAAMDRFVPDSNGQGLAGADVVIEAIFEDLEVKQALYRDIEPRMRPETVLATNTSSIPLGELSAALAQPGRLVGLHFFNPVAKMQLVEVVSDTATDTEVADRAAAFVRQIDRLPLPVASTPGFLVNRTLMPYLLEAVALLGEGVPPALVDRAAVDFGMPMGPVELADTVGLDICLSVAEILAQRLGGGVPDTLRDRVLAGNLGRKSERGFYEWRKGKPVRGKPARDYRPPADLQDRLMLRLLNEAVASLREGVVGDADLLDAGVIFGTGFAPFRGGPLHHARHTGPEALRAQLEELAERHGERFAPDPGWREV